MKESTTYSESIIHIAIYEFFQKCMLSELGNIGKLHSQSFYEIKKKNNVNAQNIAS
jgi:hypothetical protein